MDLFSELQNPEEIPLDKQSSHDSADMKLDEEIERPFLPMWDLLEKLEMMRRKRKLPDDRHQMTLIVIAQVGSEEFLRHAKHVHAMREIAQFYGTDLNSAENLHMLLE